jgi:hypothetical protein
MTAPVPSPARLSVSSTLAERLKTIKGQLAVRVIDEMYEDPFWIERFAARGRRHSEEDIGFHVDYLVQAVIAHDPGVLERYARWLQSVLTTRGMCSRHLEESFERLDRAVTESMGSDFGTSYLEAARRALLYESGTLAREIQDQARHLSSQATATLPAGKPRDFEHHLSYLADAIALDKPSLFETYVTFCTDHYGRHREGGAEYAAQTFATLRKVIANDAAHLSEAARLAADRILPTSSK